jgi:hypothetical protein
MAYCPAWIGKDACAALGISKYRDAIADLNEDERMSVVVDTPGGKQKMIAVNEAGLYQLVLKAPPHVAQPFTRWLTHEVISCSAIASILQPEFNTNSVERELNSIGMDLNDNGVEIEFNLGIA